MESFVLDPTYWLLQTVAMILTAFFIPGLKISGPISALVAVIALTLCNALLWDTRLFMEIPSAFTMRAAIVFLSNGVLFYFLVKLLPGIEMDGILPALLAPLVFSICSIVVGRVGMQIDWGKVFEGILQFIDSLRTSLKPADSPTK